MIDTQIFVEVMLKATRDVCRELPVTPEDESRLALGIAGAATAQQRVDTFHCWLKGMWKKAERDSTE